MSRAIRKPRPSVPHWFWSDNDNCWFCSPKKRGKACNGCKVLKRQNHEKDRAIRHRNKQLLKSEKG